MNFVGYTKVAINPWQPTRQCGFLQQTEAITEVHDDLMLRVLRIDTPDLCLIHYVYDNIGFSLEQAKIIREKTKCLFDHKTEVVVSCTHTHFGADPHHEIYFNQVKKISLETIKHLHIKAIKDLRVSFQTIDFNKVGHSRIKNHDAKIVLDVLSLYEGEKRIITEVIYNCHPTIMNAYTPYFSAEYPGVLLRDLENSFDDESFIFLQGADGDVSTRNTRIEQNYQEVQRLGLLLSFKVKDLLRNKIEKTKVDLAFETRKLQLKHQLRSMGALETQSGLSDRDLENIEVGKKVYEALKANFDNLPKELELSKISWGIVNQIFAPNELFSDYLKTLPKESSTLACYSQGYLPYVSGLEEIPLTYELFTDTLTQETKKNYIKTLEELAKGN